MGAVTPVRSASTRPSNPWLTVGVGAACLALGLHVGRFTAPKPLPTPNAPSPSRPARGGLAGFADAMDNVTKKTEAANKALEAQRSGIARPQPTARTPAAVPDLTNAEEQLKTSCGKKWGSNFHMVAYCQQEQREAVEKLQQTGPSDVPFEVFATIRANCAADWPADFHMRVYCEGEQVKGYRDSR